MSPFKCAVLGVGGRGKDHAKWIKNHKKAELVAVADINENRAKSVAQDFKCKAYRDYRELIEKEDLDAVFIASPHYLHAPMTEFAAENDCHVFCEKPMAINLAQADAMINACRKNDVKLAIGLQKRYVPEFEYLALAAQGAEGDLGSLGRITDIYMTARHYRSEMYYLSSAPVDPSTGVSPGPWRGRWDTEGAGILINQAIHNIDIFRWVAGPIRTLTAYGVTLSPDHKFIEVEDTVAVSMELESGAVGTMILTSSNKKQEPNKIVIHGTEGVVMASGGYAGEYITMDTRYKDEEDYDIPYHMEPHLRDQVENFFWAIENDEEPRVNGEIGRQSIEVVRGILKSIQMEGSVRFPLKDTMTYPFVYNANHEKPPEF